MTILRDFQKYLKAQPTISAIVGGRIFFDRLRQGTKTPALIIDSQGAEHPEYLAGEADISMLDIQLDCYADTEQERDQLSQVVVDLGKDHTWVQIGDAHSGYFKNQGRFYTYSDDTAGQDKGRFVGEVDVELHYKPGVTR